MGQVKLTVQRGRTALKDVNVAAGAAEAQTDTLSLNIDHTRMGRGDALLLVEQARQALLAGKWPPVASGAPAQLAMSGSVTSATVGDTTPFAPTISGGTAPYALSVVAGALPPGRTISGTSVTGGYTTAGSYGYTLRVTDAAGATADLAVGPVVVSAAGGSALAVSRPALTLAEFWNLWGDSTTAGVGAPTGSDYPSQVRALIPGDNVQPWHGSTLANTTSAAALTASDVGNGGVGGQTSFEIAERVSSLAGGINAAEMTRPQIFSGGLNDYNGGSTGFSTTLAYGRNWPGLAKSNLAQNVTKIGGGKPWFHVLAPMNHTVLTGIGLSGCQLANHVFHKRDMIATHGRRILDFARTARDSGQASTAGTTMVNSGPDYGGANLNGVVPYSLRSGSSTTVVAYNDAPALIYTPGAAGAPSSLDYAEGQIAFNTTTRLEYRKLGASGSGSWEAIDGTHFTAAGYGVMARMVGDAIKAENGDGPPYATPQEFLTTTDVAAGAVVGQLVYTGTAAATGNYAAFTLTTDQAGTMPATAFAISATGQITRTATGTLAEGYQQVYAWANNSYGQLRSVVDIYVDKPASAAPRRFNVGGTGVPLYARTSHGMANGQQISGAFLVNISSLTDAPFLVNMSPAGASGAGVSAFTARVNGSGLVQFTGVNAAGTSLLASNGNVSAGVTAGAWLWLLFSIDIAAGTAQFYVNDTAKTWAPTFASGNVNFADTAVMLYSSRGPQQYDDGATQLKGGFGPALLFPGYVDWSVTANRRSLFNADTTPAVRTPFSAVGGVTPKFDTSSGLGGLLWGPSKNDDPQSLLVPHWRARSLVSVAA